MLGEPRDGLVLRRIEEQPAAVDEEDARRELQRPSDAVLGEHHRRAEPVDGSQEEARGLRIELGRGLVEQEQARLERERRREADPLELSAGELDSLPPPQVERVHGLQRPLDSRPDLGRRGAEVLQSERDLVRGDRHHDLVLRILEDRRSRARKLCGARVTRVEARDDHAPRKAAAVEMRDEPGERPQQRRLAGAGGAEERHHLSRLERERHVSQRWRRTRIREREPADRR